MNALTLVTNWTKVDGHTLVGATELGNAILLQCRLEAYKLLVVGAVVEDADGRCIYILDNTLALPVLSRSSSMTTVTVRSWDVT